MTADTHLTPSQAARKLNVSYKTVDRYGDTGLLTAIRTPYGRLFNRDEVDALALSRQVTPVAA